MTSRLPIIALLILVLGLRVFFSGIHQPKTQVEDNQFLAWQRVLSQRFLDNLPSPQAGLLSGMVLGDQNHIDKNLKKAMQITSTIHIAVVSGQNLSLLAGFLMVFVSYLGRKKTVLMALIICTFYALLTGFGVPVIRALIMVGLAFSAQLFNREADSVWILSLTALSMLIMNPDWILSVSFQLSFAATIAVLVVSPLLEQKMQNLPDFLRTDLAVSMSVQLLTLPIIAYNFGTFSLVGVLANILVLWTVSLIMILGIIGLMLSFLPLSHFFWLIPGVLLTYFVYIVNFLSGLTFAYFNLPQLNLLVWLGYYLCLLAIICQLKSKAYDLELAL